YRDSAKRLEQLLGYNVLSHQAIREKLLEKAEQETRAAKRRPARVLFVEVDGLYTKLQRSKKRGMENAIAVVHEGWEKSGKRVRLKNKQHYLHTTGGNFWEGFGDFLAERYEIDENTWLVVNGDGAAWIGECESYFHQCLYMLDRFHVARDLKRFVGHLPSEWEAVRRSLAKQDAAALMAALEGVAEHEIAEEQRREWKQYKGYLK
ncbi:ISLre2 family transposase, partial [Paenibacillus cisolokensis]|uniref:ISLre2 family transposase n=1 Tax=Paenibacillus cisolokensis TaxID=1658519 RepID=UPI003D2B29C4